MHALLLQELIPAGQTVPQTPQFPLSLVRSLSQPSLSLLPLQSPKPVAQAPVQTPPAQARVVTWLLEQLLGQAPQWLGSVRVLVSQPSPRRLPLQSAKPLVQLPEQLPPVQAAVMLTVEQPMPQPPQLAGSVLRLTSQPSFSLSLLQ